jgi:hypothetical protein
MPRLLWKDDITCLHCDCVTTRHTKMLLEEVLGSNKHLKNIRQLFQMMLAYGVWPKMKGTGSMEMPCCVRVLIHNQNYVTKFAKA